jgi:predicted dithiol-disulfide oxidoreductase (DUF899 family)
MFEIQTEVSYTWKKVILSLQAVFGSLTEDLGWTFKAIITDAHVFERDMAFRVVAQNGCVKYNIDVRFFEAAPVQIEEMTIGQLRRFLQAKQAEKVKPEDEEERQAIAKALEIVEKLDQQRKNRRQAEHEQLMREVAARQQGRPVQPQ